VAPPEGSEAAGNLARRRLGSSAGSTRTRSTGGWTPWSRCWRTNSARFPSRWWRRWRPSCPSSAPRLHRGLLGDRGRDAARVVDVLFDAQEHRLPPVEMA